MAVSPVQQVPKEGPEEPLLPGNCPTINERYITSLLRSDEQLVAPPDALKQFLQDS